MEGDWSLHEGGLETKNGKDEEMDGSGRGGKE